MKKVISMMLIFVLALSLAACSNDKNIGEENSEHFEDISGAAEKLTMDALFDLSQKENLTWVDFEKYGFKNVGTDKIVYEYKINDEYTVRVEGYTLDDEPSLITLHNKTTNDSIDIRDSDIESFIEQNNILSGNGGVESEDGVKHIYVMLQNRRYEAFTTDNKEAFEKYGLEVKLSKDIVGDRVAYLEYDSKMAAFVDNYRVSQIEVFEHKNHDRAYILLMEGQYYLLTRI